MGQEARPATGAEPGLHHLAEPLPGDPTRLDDRRVQAPVHAAHDRVGHFSERVDVGSIDTEQVGDGRHGHRCCDLGHHVELVASGQLVEPGCYQRPSARLDAVEVGGVQRSHEEAAHWRLIRWVE